MRKNKKPNIWDLVARIILRSRALILACILLLTIFWSTQWKYMQFTYTEANLLPDNHPENVLYQSFTKTFGEEGNIIVIALRDSTFFKKDKREVWKNLNEKIQGFDEIKLVLSTENIQELVKDKKNQRFIIKSVSETHPPVVKLAEKFKEKLFLELPFYDNLLYDKTTNTIRGYLWCRMRWQGERIVMSSFQTWCETAFMIRIPKIDH